jgi:hypothetical protein
MPTMPPLPILPPLPLPDPRPPRPVDNMPPPDPPEEIDASPFDSPARSTEHTVPKTNPTVTVEPNARAAHVPRALRNIACRIT